MSRGLTSNKQTTIRVDSWIVEELNALKKGTDTLGTVITKLLIANREIDKLVTEDTTICTLNGLAKVGDEVVAVQGATGKYTIVDIVKEDYSNGMVLEPKDKYTDKIIPSRSAFWDYAILNRGVNDEKWNIYKWIVHGRAGFN